MSTNAAFSNMINALVERAFQKIVRYDCDYEKQLAELKGHRQSAQKVSDTLLEGRIVTVIGVLNSTFGYLDKAQENFFEARDIYQRIDKPDRVISVYINLTRASTTMGEHERALKFCAEGLALPHINDYPAEYAGLLGNRLVALMATGQYDEAERCIHQLNAIIEPFVESNSQYYARIMTHVYRDEAELALHQRKFAEAHSKVNLGLELAQSLALRLELADLYFTCAHIALVESPEASETIDDYFARADESLHLLESPVMMANCLLTEAQQLKRQQQHTRAKYFAQRAAELFAAHQLSEPLARAEQILQGAGD